MTGAGVRLRTALDAVLEELQRAKSPGGPRRKVRRRRPAGLAVPVPSCIQWLEPRVMLSAAAVTTPTDSFANRTRISGDAATVNGSNAAASKEAGEPDHAGNAGGASVWWTWTARASGLVTIDTAGSDFDTLLGIYTGIRIGALTAVASNDDSALDGTSRVSFTAEKGKTYQIAVDGRDGATGNIVLNLSLAATSQPLAPAALTVDAVSISQIDLSWSDASNNETGFIIERRQGTGAWTQIAAVGPNVTGYQDSGLPSNTPFSYRVKATNGYGVSAPTRVVSQATNAVPPVNDDFSSAASLTGQFLSTTGTNVGATKETDEPDHAGNAGGKSVWWTWTAPDDGAVTINTNGSGFKTLLAVYTGNDVSSLTAVASSVNTLAGNSVTFTVTQGTTYRIAVDGVNGASGDVALNLALNTHPSPSSGFDIQLNFKGLTPSQIVIFEEAAARWEQIIIGDLPSAVYHGKVIDDLRIDASAKAIDGAGGILGQADPKAFRAESFLPYYGIMQFDSADLARMETSGQLLPVIMHEMGHVLGFGTIWKQKGLLLNAGYSNPRFLGAQAVAAYDALFGVTDTGVPVEGNNSPVGSRDSHWRESFFGTELMTPYISGNVAPLSIVTIASMADLGYQVDMSQADPFTPPPRQRSGSVTSGSSSGGSSLQDGSGVDSDLPPDTYIP